MSLTYEEFNNKIEQAHEVKKIVRKAFLQNDYFYFDQPFSIFISACKHLHPAMYGNVVARRIIMSAQWKPISEDGDAIDRHGNRIELKTSLAGSSINIRQIRLHEKIDWYYILATTEDLDAYMFKLSHNDMYHEVHDKFKGSKTHKGTNLYGIRFAIDSDHWRRWLTNYSIDVQDYINPILIDPELISSSVDI